jgi:hypothetical protein
MKRKTIIQAGKDLKVTIELERNASSYGKEGFMDDWEYLVDYITTAILKKYHFSDVKLKSGGKSK